MFTCSGIITLVADRASGITRRTASGDVVVRVPLVGSKAETAIISGLREHADLEAEVLDRWVESGEHRRTVG
jgi:hypothetical protein